MRVNVTAVAAVASLVSIYCTDTSTSLLAPSTAKCQIASSAGQSSFGPAGGSASLTVSAPRECSWTASVDATWIRITGSSSGQGDGAVPFSVTSNSVPSPRSSSIVVGQQQIPISQAAAACTFQVNPTSKSVAAGGETVSIAVTTLAGCGWTATSEAAWITIASGQSGSASATVALSIAANNGEARSGLARVAGQAVTLSQVAAPRPAPAPPPNPSPAPSPAPPAPPPSGEHIDLSGVLSKLTGQCPNVSFLLMGRTVTADRDTDYKHGKCADLSKSNRVSVRGRTTPSGSVAAERITLDD